MAETQTVFFTFTLGTLATGLVVTFGSGFLLGLLSGWMWRGRRL